MRWLVVVGLYLLFALQIVGCGGGGSSSGGDTFVKPTIAIVWPARTKAITATGSALSAVILLHGASHTGADMSFTVDRSGPVTGSTVMYTGPEDAKVGTLNISVTFYAGTGGAGDVVGSASGAVSLAADGNINADVTTTGAIAAVEIPSGQQVKIGETRTLEVGCRNGNGELVAVSPGSVSWSVTSGADKLEFTSGDAHGLSAGLAEVTATIDGKASAATTVAVIDPPFKTIPNFGGPTGISADGSTVVGSVAGLPGYWTEPTGPVSLPVTGDKGGKVTAVSSDGSQMAGYVSAGSRYFYAFHWTRGGVTHPILSPSGTEKTYYQPIGISDDGLTVVSAYYDEVTIDSTALATKWSAAGGTSLLTDALYVRASSGDASVLAGLDYDLGAVLWTATGGLEVIPGAKEFLFASSDGLTMAGVNGLSVIVWNRTRGLTTLGNGTLCSMSRNGKYVLYRTSTGTYIWSADKGSKLIAPLLIAAGAPANLDFNTAKHYISDDGRTMTGTYLQEVSGVNQTFVYVVKLPEAP